MIAYKKVDSGYSLEGKTALITGGAAGIGHAVAQFFAEKGVSVALVDLNPDVNDVAKKLSPDAIGIVTNVTKTDDVQNAVDKTVQAFGKIDILVNCAGIVRLEAAEDISMDDWNSTIAVNLTASFIVAQIVGRQMIKQEGGAIVNIASQAGIIALDKHVAYCASKGGIIAMTKVLAMEWAKYGVRVNAISPTVVLTELGHQAWDGPKGEAMKKEIPAGRFAEPDEIAGCVAFLCSQAAAMITGENMLIDGGYTIK